MPVYMTLPRVGFIVTSEVCEEINKEEAVYLNDRRRPWLKNAPTNLTAINTNIDKGTSRMATNGDVSIALYLANKLRGKVVVDIICPENITVRRLRANDINFIIIYDLLEAFHTDLPSTVNKVAKVFSQCNNLYPSNEMMKLINYKQNYYKYLQDRGVPIAAFKILHRKDWLKMNDAGKIRKIGNIVNSMDGWNKCFVTKPMLGQASIMVKRFNRDYSKEYIAAFVNSTMKVYPGVIFQELMREFATKKCKEFRCYFIGDQFQYCIITDNGKPKIDKAEGGRYHTPGYNQAIRLAKRTIKLLPCTKIRGVTLPRLLTRIDVGTAVKRNTKVSDGQRVVFVSEVELVPSLYIEDTKKMPDSMLGDQVIKILKKLDLV